MTRGPCAALAIVWVLLTAAPSAFSGVVWVPDDYPSVLEAADAVGFGDSVLVRAGVWSERESREVVLNGQTQVVRSSVFLAAGVTVVAVEGATRTALVADTTSADEISTIVLSSCGQP